MDLSKHETASRRGVAWQRLIFLLPACLLVCCLTSCSSDDDDGGTGPGTTTPEQQMEEGMAGLVGFGLNTVMSPEVSVLRNPNVIGLLSGMGLELPDLPGIGGLGFAPGNVRTKELIENMLPSLTGGRAGFTVDDFYGTYARDREDYTDPFPGWVIATPDVPADGLIFRFPADSMDVVIVDIQTGTITPVAGELRFLGINTDFDPDDPDSEITTMVFEMAIGPDLDHLVTEARISYEVEYDFITGEPSMVRIGDQNDIGDTYIGSTSFALWLDVVNLNDMDIGIQVVDTSTSPNYAIRLEAEVENYNPITELPGAVTLTLSYGLTNTPTTPPWVFTVALTEITEDPGGPDELFDAVVNGSVVYQNQTMATFGGTTDDVPVNVDINGDGVVDANDNCIDITIVFADGTSGNICVVFFELAGMIPTDGIGAIVTGPFCRCALR